MPTPSADAFRALARSSPWRWSTLRFTVRWPADPWKAGQVRAWLRRPDALRVESVDGELLHAGHEPGRRGTVLSSGGGNEVPLSWPPADGVPEPVRRPDGLVAWRPGDHDLFYDAPMYTDYRWVAMLDPVELADGGARWTGEPGPPPLILDELVETEHGDRPAWEAVVVPTPAYEPRCGCCPLLRTRRIDELEYADHPGHLLPAYPEAFRVRLDVQTGVCVRVDDPGALTAGLDVRIEAVDEPMDDALFTLPRRGGTGRRCGWAPA